jgi:hypothetical protein
MVGRLTTNIDTNGTKGKCVEERIGKKHLLLSIEKSAVKAYSRKSTIVNRKCAEARAPEKGITLRMTNAEWRISNFEGEACGGLWCA